jgi:hypothetical protein
VEQVLLESKARVGGRMKVNVKIIKERKREKKEMMLSLAPTL